MRVFTNFMNRGMNSACFFWYRTQAAVSRLTDHPCAAVAHTHVPIVILGYPGWAVLDQYRIGMDYVWNLRLGMVPDQSWKI